MTADLDIIIASHNTRDDLLACLASLEANPPARLRHVIVVDNASSDGSVESVRARFPAVRVTALDRNMGFGAANNVALRATDAPLVLLLNSDTLVPAGAVDALASRLLSTGAVAAGPRLIDGQGRPEISCGAMLSPLAELRQWIWTAAARSDARVVRSAVFRRLERERDVGWVSGACLLLRRDAAHAAGFFDERFFLYEEDVDLCAALRAGGGRVLFTPQADVVHRRGRSVARAGAAASAYYDRSHVLFYEKHRPFWTPWLRLWLAMRGRRIR